MMNEKMKLLCFNYKDSVEEITEKISKNKNIFVKVKRNDILIKIKINKRENLYHPLKRIFVGKIKSEKEGSIIVGKFRYPFIISFIYGISLLILLKGNIEMILSNINMTSKISGACIFIFMYIVIALFFISGKYLFIKQEHEIIMYLKSLGNR